MKLLLLMLLSGLPFIGMGILVLAAFSKVINKTTHARVLGVLGTVLTILGAVVWAKHDAVVAHLISRGHL